MSLLLTAPPTSEPVTLSEAKVHLRVGSSAEDTLISALIAAARQVAENECRRAFITQTWEKTLDLFPEAIELPYPRTIGVTAITYLDRDGAAQTLSPASYLVDTKSEPGWVTPAYGYAWPETYLVPNAVTVTYTAGYGANGAAVPNAIKQWILLMVGHYFENREASVPGVSMTPLPFIDGLLDPYRVMQVA